MTPPTIGAALLYQPQHPDTVPNRDQPLSATVTTVHTDRLVDIEGKEIDGGAFSDQRVMLLQDDDDAPISGRFAYWPGAEHRLSPVRGPQG